MNFSTLSIRYKAILSFEVQDYQLFALFASYFGRSFCKLFRFQLSPYMTGKKIVLL